MTTREPEADGERVLWRGTERDDDRRHSGEAGPEAGQQGRDRPGPAPESGHGSGSTAVTSGVGAASVRRRALLKGLGGGAVVTGLAGCPMDDTGGTDDPGGSETPDHPGSETPGGGDGQQTETQCFETKADCPGPCDDECVFRIEFTYDYERASDGSIEISRFRLEFVESTSEDGTPCEAELASGDGTFEFDVAGEQPCSVDLPALLECDCGMRVKFEDLDESDGEDCICPDFQQSPPPDCRGEPVWIEKTGDFESITIDFEQRAACLCEDQANVVTIDVQIRYQDGELAFGGDTADC